MKTRKVGRVLSLLLAIAMVVGLMIPTSSVLAETAGTAFDDNRAIVVHNYDELKEALDSAATDGTKTYIKIADVLKDSAGNNTGSDIIQVEYPKTETGRGDSQVQYCVAMLVFITNVSDSTGTLNAWKNSGKERILNYLDAINATHPNIGPFYTEDNPLTINTNTYYWDYNRYTCAALESFLSFDDDKDQKIYDSNFLIIRSGSDVVLDLNGKTIRGLNQSDSFSGSPEVSAPIFEVRGNFTVLDRSAGKTGKIEGGTGYVLDGISQTDNSIEKDVYREFDPNWNYVSPYGGDLGRLLKNSSNNERYRLTYERWSYWYHNAVESRGGGVYVAPGASFTLESGTISNNTSWMSVDEKIFKSGVNAVAKGGGVYVSAGATFTMYGGEISNNAVRSYQKDTAKTAYAYGGGVYLAPAVKNSDGTTVAIPGAHMEFTGGKIAGNAVYAETNQETNVVSQGAGVYIAEGATLNMLGAAEASGATTDEMLASFPQVTDNSCGVTNRDNNSHSMSLTAEGAGIYNAGTLNIRKAVVSANDFSEFSRDDMNDPPVGVTVVSVVRDEQTGLAQYTRDGELITAELAHETSGKFGVGRGSSRNTMITNGAGVCVTDTGTINIGERTWIYDNWDLVTQGHKAFGNTRNYTRHWDAEKGEYVYDSESTGAGNGYCWSDTRDDVYLSGDRVMYIGEDLFECKIGVNYDRMVGAKAEGSEAVAGKLGQASNRVIVRMSDDLDSSVWGEKSYTPRNRDIQFFFLNDNNKNWEHNNPEATGKIAYEVGNTPENATFPQRSMEILNAEGKAGATELHSDVVVTGGYDSSKYMNYKVYWDNGDATRTDYPNDGTFGTPSEPVLRFAEMNRKSYLTFEFPEANKIFYGQPVENTKDYTYNTEMRYLSYIDGFDNADKTSLPSREVNILMPDYTVYKSGVLSGITVGSPNSITNGADGKEAEDLYFKGWSFYTSYGYGPETVCPTNGRDTTTETKAINDIATRGMFNIDVTKINNDNVNAQLCPSFVAQWYTADELADARTRVSNVKAQAVVLANDAKAIRFIALVDSRYAQYEEAGFVFSLNNATPTVEGGYDFSSKSKIYKKVMTKTSATSAGEWIDVYYMMHPEDTPAGTMKVNWTEFKDAKGILYTNIIVNDESESTVYYATPYVRDGTTYYYGESRAISYDWLIKQDAASANS